MGWFTRKPRLAAAVPLPPPTPPATLADQLTRLAATRAGDLVASRAQAIQNPVVMRSRDLVCGVLSQLPFKRTGRDGSELGAGWLNRPDPNHTRGWFVAQVTDDLMFYGYAYAWVTVWDATGHPLALEWAPYVNVIVNPDGSGLTYHRRGSDQAGVVYPAAVHAVELSWAEVLVFESPLTAILNGTTALTTAARLEAAALRFAATEVPAGHLHQVAGDDLSDTEALKRIALWETARRNHTTGYVGQDLAWVESTLDPSRMQLVEARSYQDAAVARVTNIPNFALGIGVPHDSMTYKTAVTARYDLIDFGIAPYIGAWEQTLSGNQATPAGTVVAFDLEPFLRSDALAHVQTGAAGAADVAAAPTDTVGV